MILKMCPDYHTNFEPTATQKNYLERVENFRERIENINTKTLERYQSLLEPKKLLEHFAIFISDSEQALRLYVVSKVLEKRDLSDKKEMSLEDIFLKGAKLQDL